MMGFDRILLTLLLAVLAQPAVAADLEKRIPDEYETTSGFGHALNNAGVAATDQHAAIRTNPALLPFQRGYSVSAGYHWPSAGREFYQASIVDAKTAQTAAGVSYTGFSDNYRYEDEVPRGQARDEARADSPIVRRGVLGLGQVFGKLSAGIGGTYVEANQVRSTASGPTSSKDKVKGFGINIGLATPITEQLRAGVAVENASNRRIQDYVPRTYRAGLAYSLSPTWTAALDYRQRDRVLEFEGERTSLADAGGGDLMDRPEQMAFASVTAQLEESFRLMGSYGQAFAGDDRRALAGGAALTSKNFSLSYTMSRPYMNRSSTAHQAVSLSVEMSM